LWIDPNRHTAQILDTYLTESHKYINTLLSVEPATVCFVACVRACVRESRSA
jgi:hypothetical protein